MEITDGEIYILTAREPLLALNDSTWIKCRNDNFDVLMWVYNSAQVADLACFYILDILRIVDPKLVSLYRDGLIFVPNRNGPFTVKLQKLII